LADKKNLAQCASCHETEPPRYLKGDMQTELAARKYNRVILPEQLLKKDSL